MSYQVLARKWRPRSFEDMVGQTHVVRALANALDQGRLHHAYLFTGTRGVGKTTLARILSKALNCDEGVGSRPCGRCGTCREVDEGRFVDLLEVDAASRTKVDQTRELLDNVPFAPVKGRYKVYLIDEVHMFSTSSFNALLKTLEEPPPHVKFLLATTDPRKVPATVLSRCLQFNLKRLIPEEICEQLAQILEAEGIEFEDQSLKLLARAADGSMRDGLSLLDQAIAFGGGRVTAGDVGAMLGTVGRDLGVNLVRALADLDGSSLLDEVARIHELTPDFGGVLQEVLGLLHRIALYQQVPTTLTDDDPAREEVIALARDVSPEDVQLYYQIALQGQRDLPLAPDPRTGMEMVLLRMLAFRPAPGGGGVAPDPPGEGRSAPHGRPTAPARAPSPAEPTVSAPPEASGKRPSVALAAARRATGIDRTIANAGDARTREPPGAPPGPAPAPPAASTGGQYPGVRDEAVEPEAVTVSVEGAGLLRSPQDWHGLVKRLGLGGVAGELALHCELGGWDGRRLVLILDPASSGLRVPIAEARLRESLKRELGQAPDLEFRIDRPEGETPARRMARKRVERQAAADALMDADPVARALRGEFGGRFMPGTIVPTDTPAEPGGENN